MDYRKTKWDLNTVIHPDHLNHLEEGIEQCSIELNNLYKLVREMDLSLDTQTIQTLIQNSIYVHNMQGTAHQLLFDEVRTAAQDVNRLKAIVLQQAKQIQELQEKLGIDPVDVTAPPAIEVGPDEVLPEEEDS